jgi:hypothetical protein
VKDRQGEVKDKFLLSGKQKFETLKHLGPLELQKRFSKSLHKAAESMPPIVKSWRDTGDTPCRQKHQEEAKL